MGEEEEVGDVFDICFVVEVEVVFIVKFVLFGVVV